MYFFPAAEIDFGQELIDTNENQTPSADDAGLFLVDATSLTANRTIIPQNTDELRALSFKIIVPTSSLGFYFQLVGDNATLDLNEKIWADMVFRDGVWQIADWKIYRG